MDNTFKTYVTPELRTAVREQLQQVVYNPTSKLHEDAAYNMTRLARALVAQITDEDIDKILLQIHNEYDSRRIPL